jgi:hypothetical protein
MVRLAVSPRRSRHRIRSLASGHSAVHLLQCGAMVYLFAAVTTSGSLPMAGWAPRRSRAAAQAAS